MKKLIYTITALVAFAISANAQVGVETDQVSEKAILDFPDVADGAILLPYVDDPTTAGGVAGTLLYNADDGAVYIRDNSDWQKFAFAQKNGTPAQHTLDSNTDANGTVISNTGADATATGVLVLESTDRALALPKVDGVENLESPKPGMICFDTSRNALAIYNGEVWVLRN